MSQGGGGRGEWGPSIAGPSGELELDLPDLQPTAPPVRELAPHEPSFDVQAIELADVPPRRASVRPEVAPVRAEIDLARVDARTLDVAHVDVRGLQLEAAAPRAPSFRPPHVPVAPIARTEETRAIARAPHAFEDTFQFDTPLVNGAALPAAFAFAILLHLIHLGTTVFMTVGMWTHELGHAIVLWISGFVAIPLPFVTIATSDDRSIIVILLVAVAWIALGVHGVRSRNRAVIAGAAALGVLQVWMTGFMSPGRAFQWVLFSGLGGEVVLSTLGVLAFYQRFPLRWDFWRYLVLVTAMVAYVHSLLRWVGVGLGITEMPHGAASGDNSEGDVERLIRTHEFTMGTLARTYITLSIACAGVMVLAYVYYLRRAQVRARERERQIAASS